MTRSYLPLGAVALLLISCGGGGDTTAPTPAGSLVVKTATGGSQRDPNGYTLTSTAVGGSVPIAIDTAIRKDDLTPGSYPITLSGLAGNCHAPALTDTAHVVDAGIDTVRFAVTCDSTFGTLKVRATTGGGSPDADGYAVRIDGVTKGTVPANGVVSIPGVAQGQRIVTLAGLAANCALTGQSTDTVTVAGGGSDSVAFTASCPTPAIVILSVNTTGIALDPDGYSIFIDSTVHHLVPSNESNDTLHLSLGAHTLDLQGVVLNCAPNGASHRSVALSEGAVDSLTFAITCAPPRVAVAKDIPGKSYGLFLINPDGTNPTNILPFDSTGGARAPSWSPDRQAIAFQKGYQDQGTGLEIVNSDGTHAHTVFDSLGVIFPRWSPKGDRILFTYHPGGVLSSINARIWVVDTSGANAAPLLTDSLGEFSADWSPSGDSVVIHRYAPNGAASGNTEFIVLDLTTDSISTLIPASTSFYASQGARWSPTGDRIAYRCGTLVVCAVGVHDSTVATSNLPDLLVNPFTWSPDGTTLLAAAQIGPVGYVQLVRITPGIDGWTAVTSDNGLTIEPDWK